MLEASAFHDAQYAVFVELYQDGRTQKDGESTFEETQMERPIHADDVQASENKYNVANSIPPTITSILHLLRVSNYFYCMYMLELLSPWRQVLTKMKIMPPTG